MKLKWKQKRMDGDAYMEKVSTMALCSLTYQLSRKQQKSFKNKATVDAHWVCMMTAPYSTYSNRHVWECVYIHRVGFCVARP